MNAGIIYIIVTDLSRGNFDRETKSAKKLIPNAISIVKWNTGWELTIKQNLACAEISESRGSDVVEVHATIAEAVISCR